MSKVSKTAKINKFKQQIVDLRDKLARLAVQNSNNTMSDYFERRIRPHIGYDRQKQMVNIRKKIAFLERKITALEGQ